MSRNYNSIGNMKTIFQMLIPKETLLRCKSTGLGGGGVAVAQVTYFEKLVITELKKYMKL
jgi:hypothetical protein